MNPESGTCSEEDFIPFIAPTFPDPSDIAVDVKETVEANRFANGGPFQDRLVASVNALVGAGTSSTTQANGTLALMLMLRALVQVDKLHVIVPSFTFPAGPLSILWNNLKPVFIDVSPDSWQPIIADAQEAFANEGFDVGAILLTNTLGVGTEDINSWEKLAAAHDVPLIIDSAAGFGGHYADGSQCGSRGTAEMFSLHITKPFGIGEGGLITSRHEEVIATVNELQNFGFDETGSISSVGLNAKLPELSCAIALRQLEALDARIHRRRGIIKMYRNRLEPLGYHFLPGLDRSSAFCAAMTVPDGTDRNETLIMLAHHGIQARSYYHPGVHQHPLFEKSCRVKTLDATERLSEAALSLPASESLTIDQVEFICDTLQDRGTP